jgi:hypothetical protein
VTNPESGPSAPSIKSLVLVPALITLAVTLARLFAEFGGLPSWLASAAAGGGGAVLGISWLPLIFGPYFALRLARSDTGGFKKLFRVMLVYGLAARIPVILITIAAVFGEWGTHYDNFGQGPDTPPDEVFGVGIKIGITVGAQLVFWAVVWTGLVGSAVGLIVARLAPRR